MCSSSKILELLIQNIPIHQFCRSFLLICDIVKYTQSHSSIGNHNYSDLYLNVVIPPNKNANNTLLIMIYSFACSYT